MSSMPRTVTLPTADHGAVTLPEPSWCAGHAGHDPRTFRVDLLHTGPDIPLTFRGRDLSVACLAQAPYAEQAGRNVFGSEFLYGAELDAVGLYEYAARLDAYADQLRGLADQLDALALENQ